jgi:hypothetical protein
MILDTASGLVSMRMRKEAKSSRKKRAVPRRIMLAVGVSGNKGLTRKKTTYIIT